jgi:hypothetical protein
MSDEPPQNYFLDLSTSDKTYKFDTAVMTLVSYVLEKSSQEPVEKSS